MKLVCEITIQPELFKMRADLECSNLAVKFLFSYSGFTVFSPVY